MRTMDARDWTYGAAPDAGEECRPGVDPARPTFHERQGATGLAARRKWTMAQSHKTPRLMLGNANQS